MIINYQKINIIFNILKTYFYKLQYFLLNNNFSIKRKSILKIIFNLVINFPVHQLYKSYINDSF